MTTPLSPSTLENSLLPTYFTPPLLNPAPGGLWNSVAWTEETGPPRWAEAGIAFLSAVVGNYSGELSAGIWGAGWCDEPGSGSTVTEMKTGVRPDDPATFYATTAWAFDACDLRPDSRAEVLARVQQVLRMREPVMVAREFAERLLADAGAPTPADDLTDAIGELECIFAEANTTGVIHASPKLLPHLVSHMLVSRSGIGWATPSGHTVVVDGGYRAALGDSLFIASSALFGWRVQPEVRSVPDVEDNMFVAICERSCLIGFEQALGAVSVEVGS